MYGSELGAKAKLTGRLKCPIAVCGPSADALTQHCFPDRRRTRGFNPVRPLQALEEKVNMNNRLALLPVVGALLIIAIPAFAGGPLLTPEPSTVFLIGGGLGALI